MATISNVAHRSWYLAVVLAALAAPGCGGPKTRVNGQVTFGGRPVETGVISFEPADGQGPSAGGKIQDGRYDLDESAAVTPGKKIVRIRAIRKTGKKKEAGPPFPKGHLVEEEEPYLPAIYHEKSTLTADLAAGTINAIDFHLQK